MPIQFCRSNGDVIALFLLLNMKHFINPFHTVVCLSCSELVTQKKSQQDPVNLYCMCEILEPLQKHWW